MKTNKLFSNLVTTGTRLMIFVAMMIAVIGHVTSAAAAGVSVDLCATPGSVLMPDGATVTIWGYALGDCSGSPVAGLPGPTIDVNEGDVVTLILHNGLPEATSLLFPGQAMIPDTSGAPSGSSKSYSFTASHPGTYIYEAGLVSNAEHQVAMGLYGALIVRSATAGQAYDSATTVYNDEGVLVLSEIDKTLNNSLNPAAYDMREYHPNYWLINGKAYPQTAPIPTSAGNNVLLRYVNAGFQTHSMGVLGLNQNIIAIDGNPLNKSRFSVVESIAPGRTMDVITTIPVSASTGSMFALFEANFLQHNNNASGFGGMLTFLTLGSSGPVSGSPLTSGVTLTPNISNGSSSVALSATTTGASNISAAEYYIDSISSTPSPMTASDLAFDSQTENIEATISVSDLSTLPAGSHTIYVRGQDSSGWGAFSSAVLNLDKSGPISSAATVTPGTSNGTVSLTLSATANDSANGNSTISAAEYTIDGGSSTSMTVNNAGAVISGVKATIPATTINPLSDGTHFVNVSSQDALGNWGNAVTVSFIVDHAGPSANSVSAAPSPNNGTVGYNSSTPAVRVSASFTDTLSNVTAAEGFIDTVGSNGAGFVFIAVDGLFNSSTENSYASIPLTTINALGNGNHTIYVRGKDASGNWGAINNATLIIDKNRPVVSNVIASPSPTNASNSNGTSFTLTASTTDTGFGDSNITRAEWFEGTDPGSGNGVPVYAADSAFNSSTEALTANIDFVARGWAPGNHTVYVRSRDAAGNWSLNTSTVVNVVLPNNIFADSFQLGNASSWNSTTGANVSVTPGASLNGAPAFGMGVGLAGTAAGYVTNLTPISDPSFHGRFYFNPNGSLPNNNNSANGVTIFSGLNATNTSIFQVRFRRQNNGTYQVRLSVLRSGGTTSTNWYAITNASHAIEVAWQSGSSTSARLIVDGVVKQTLNNLNTNANKLESVRLGPSAGLVAGASGVMYFDAYISTRNTVIGP